MSLLFKLRLPTILGFVLSLALVSPAIGQESGSGEQTADVPDDITLIVPFSAGGGTDTLARVLAPALQEAVDGHPSVRVVNRPGGESITGTNKFVRDNPDDGSKLLVSSATTTFQWLLGVDAVDYSFLKLKPLMVFGTGGVIYVSKESGIDSIQDLKNPPEPLSYGGISATGLDLITLLAFDVLKLDPKVTFGFGGRGPARLALLRGGTNIDYQTTPAYLTQVAPLAKQGRVVPLMTFGVLNEQGKVVRDPNFPNLPTVPEAYKMLYGEWPSGPAFKAYKAFLAAGFSFQKGLWATAETPKAVRQAFVDAVSELKQNKEFQQKRANVLGEYPLYAGPKIEGALHKAYDIPKSVKQYVFNMLETKYDVEGL